MAITSPFFDTLPSVPSLNLVQTYTFDLRVKLTPTCQSSAGSASGNHVYDIQSAVTYTDRYYAHFIGDGGCVNVQTDQATSAVAYNLPPTFSLTPLTSANATVANGIATWDLKICNTSGQSDSGINWLAVEDPSGLLTVTSIANITNPGNPVQLALLPFGQNVFAFTPGINAGQCLTLRVTASVTSCDDVDLNVQYGWNCSPYAPSWTPDDNALCGSSSLSLSAQNSGVAPIQVSLSALTSVCFGAGEEVTVSGSLTSAVPLPNDTYSLSFIWDENADGIIQGNETLVAQQNISGSVSPANPLTFSQLLQVQTDQSCQLLLKIETTVSGTCSSFTVDLPTPQIRNAGNDLTFCDVSNQFTTTLGQGAACDSTSYLLTWSAIAPASLADLSDPNIANPVLTIDPMNYLGQTLQYILATERLACGTVTFDTVQIVVPSSANGVFAEQQLDLQVANCQTLASVCAEIPSLLFPNFVFTDNGQPYLGGFSNCSGGFSLQLASGVHELVAVDTVSGCADTVTVTVNCTSTETLQVSLLIGESDTICVSSSELSGQIISLTNICQDGQFIGYQLLNDSCIILTGNLVGQENACLVACDGNGFCDTTLLVATVSHPFLNGIADTLTLTQIGQFCFDENQLNLAGTLTSIQNICPGSSGTSVQFMVDSIGFCLDYLAVGVGTENACIELCDDLGNCDTVNFLVTVVPGSVIQDTVFLLLETDTFCLPQGWLPGALVSIEDICPENNGDNVNFTVEGNCILYNGFAIGADSACFRFEDALGNVALVELQIFVRKTTPETYCDTIFVGESKLYCLDDAELPGDFADGSLHEICPDERTGNVELAINQNGKCVFYKGLTQGRDSSCIVFCDEFGFCDTTYFCFFVKPYFDPPTLGPDSTTTVKGTPVVIDFLANDTIYGGIVDIFVLDEPISGSVVLNLDNSFTYIPDNPYCARWDNFTYVACNPNGCDTTTVSIFIECIELTIFTAVSPNNDDVNDFFYIAKIEEFPDNHLWVYNIWGSLVYETTVYRNNWPGTWGADTDLPDGTYYFILEWTDNGETTVQKGYMELFR
ncbi:MAG: gliding motility-associated C-terminal domain-containing protein [Saprospiraceae bacterium]|nr:gliding motility-associated C-terminal domain-containing protein [Saprospiraceae bacterium]